MNRTEEEVVELGDYCKHILGDDRFNSLHSEYLSDHMNLMLATLPHEVKKREAIYTELHALQAFLALMGGYVSRRDEIIKRNDQPSISVEDDADDE